MLQSSDVYTKSRRQRTVKLVADIDLICSILGTLTFGFLVILFSTTVLSITESNKDQEGYIGNNNEVEIIIGIFATHLLIYLVSCIFSRILKKAARKRSTAKCKLWVIVKSISLVLSIGLFVVFNILNSDDFSAINLIWMIPVIPLIFWAFGIWIVYQFMKELNDLGNQTSEVVINQTNS